MSVQRKISPALLARLLDYSPETGKLVWKERCAEVISSDIVRKRWNTRYALKDALTCVGSSGYLQGDVMGIKCKAHRVIWALHYGRWPDANIDHINGNPLDNRIKNLRCVPQSENMKNCKTRATNKSGTPGVKRVTASKKWRRPKWRAQINVNHKQIHLGYFDDLDEAIRARRQAELDHGYHPNHGRKA